jgi:MYXO-CTERM domain-containing protein
MLRRWLRSLAWILLALTTSRLAAAETLQVACDAGALVAAVDAANTSSGPTTLTLAPKCVYTLTSAAAPALAEGPSGLPAVTSDITVDGQGATITRSAAVSIPAFRIFTVESGSLSLLNVTVANGRAVGPTPGADGRGGCIFSATSLSLSGVLVTGCASVGADSPLVTPATPGAGLGGAIYVGAGSAALVNSTLSSNSASGGSPGGDSAGAGIYELGGAITLTSVTIANGTAAHGAGIFAAQGMFTVMNSLLSDSTTNDCDVASGLVLSAGWNLVRTPGSCAGFTPTTHDLINVDPKLMSLKDNGGPTFTHGLPTSSLAVQRGHCSQATDQRGVRRLSQPVTCEIGAFEVTRLLLHISFQGTGHGTVTSTSGSVNCAGDCDTIELPPQGEDLTATPNAGSTFLGWSDACSGTGDCSVVLNQTDVTVTVTFGTVLPSPDAPSGVPDAPAAVPDAATGGQPDAGTGAGQPDAPTGGAIDAGSGGAIDAPIGGNPDGATGGDAPLAGDASVRDAGASDAGLADAMMVIDGGTGGNPDGPGPLPLDRGCGCHVGTDPADAPALLLLIGLTAVLARRRRS